MEPREYLESEYFNLFEFKLYSYISHCVFFNILSSVLHIEVSYSVIVPATEATHRSGNSQCSAYQLVPLRSPGSILQGSLLPLWRVKLQLIPGTHIK